MQLSSAQRIVSQHHQRRLIFIIGIIVAAISDAMFSFVHYYLYFLFFILPDVAKSSGKLLRFIYFFQLSRLKKEDEKKTNYC